MRGTVYDRDGWWIGWRRGWRGREGGREGGRLTLKRASSQSKGTFFTYRLVHRASTLCPRLKGSTTTSCPPIILPFTSEMQPWADAWRGEKGVREGRKEGGREGG